MSRPGVPDLRIVLHALQVLGGGRAFSGWRAVSTAIRPQTGVLAANSTARQGHFCRLAEQAAHAPGIGVSVGRRGDPEGCTLSDARGRGAGSVGWVHTPQLLPAITEVTSISRSNGHRTGGPLPAGLRRHQDCSVRHSTIRYQIAAGNRAAGARSTGQTRFTLCLLSPIPVLLPLFEGQLGPGVLG